ncbi:PREDICTED: uncharacterized protein LOC109217737 [Nicotiana attenuata]|uniref:uncharacterized protein LOC109217737 n=1 Tax=Nicotiana attenuata TaxID=49451 RepID=UPI00090564FC|nr:PREDICTED: uncharacterized protein LOC109217737 [Nicotiana attenuata]
MGPEHLGRLRLYGRGVTKTSLKRKVGDIGTSLSSTDEMLQQKMVEMEERMQQRMQEKFNAQKDAMELQVAVNIISQLKRLNPDLQVDLNMLAFNARSPGDASSAQQDAVQLINRLSTGSNNRGGATEEREDGESGATEEREDGDNRRKTVAIAGSIATVWSTVAKTVALDLLARERISRSLNCSNISMATAYFPVVRMAHSQEAVRLHINHHEAGLHDAVTAAAERESVFEE